ncbi:hypothetical protein [Arthrobacter glacialis]|uniref:hypothetical protein n=1 Tax=Arthrobacter glacialis TaxID=1664 RepID=UPI000CD3DF82|nr:hypothetical protein [Arthrobacter glacialis]POH60302.1 hypothetical protein CVS28_05070 [Arthrobacter glacialis]
MVTYVSTVLLTASAATEALSADLEVTCKNVPVRNPHLVSLVLKNIGPHDITEDKFVDDHFAVNLNQTLYEIVRWGSRDNFPPSIYSEKFGSGNGIVGFKPALIPKGAEWAVECIVSGPTTPEVMDRLVDTDIVEGEPQSRAFLNALSDAQWGAAVASTPWPRRPLAPFIAGILR